MRVSVYGKEGFCVIKLTADEASTVEQAPIQTGLTYLRYCGWFDRVWTFQEICLARKAVIQAGVHQLDWEKFSPGWHWIAMNDHMFDDRRHTYAKMSLINDNRCNTGTLLDLLRSTWNRHATNVRDKVYGVLGLYSGDCQILPDYDLTVPQVMVQIAKAAVDETQCLDILHFAWTRYFVNSTPNPAKHSWRDIDEPNRDWHLPSWVPDWERPPIDRIVMRTITSWPKLEFPDLHSDFKFDVHWRGENMVASGLALGRRPMGDYTGEPLNGPMEPFPVCAFEAMLGELRPWPNSPSLDEAIVSAPQHQNATKLNILEFAHHVKQHDEGKCPCHHNIENTANSEADYIYDYDYSNWAENPTVKKVPRLDWVVVLFGTRAIATLHPEWQARPEYWLLTKDGRYLRGPEEVSYHKDVNAKSNVGDRFTFTGVVDNHASNNPCDSAGTYVEFTQELQYLKHLSCVYADFEIF